VLAHENQPGHPKKETHGTSLGLRRPVGITMDPLASGLGALAERLGSWFDDVTLSVGNRGGDRCIGFKDRVLSTLLVVYKSECS
jgi:hypothetical protein